MNGSGASHKRLVIVGATGMVGGYALRCALRDPPVGSVTSIGRRKLGISHPSWKKFCILTLRAALHSRDALGSGRNRLLPVRVYGSGDGRGAAHDNRELPG